MQPRLLRDGTEYSLRSVSGKVIFSVRKIASGAARKATDIS